MANLYTGYWTLTDFTNIEEKSGIEFVIGTEYTIEIKGYCVLREGTVGGGLLIEGKERIQYLHRGNDLYVGKLGENNSIRINIMD